MKETAARSVLPPIFAEAFEKVAKAHSLTGSERIFLIYALDWFEMRIGDICHNAEEIFGCQPRTDAEINLAALIVCPLTTDEPSVADKEFLENLLSQPRCDLLIQAISEITVRSPIAPRPF